MRSLPSKILWAILFLTSFGTLGLNRGARQWARALRTYVATYAATYRGLDAEERIAHGCRPRQRNPIAIPSRRAQIRAMLARLVVGRDAVGRTVFETTQQRHSPARVVARMTARAARPPTATLTFDWNASRGLRQVRGQARRATTDASRGCRIAYRFKWP